MAAKAFEQRYPNEADSCAPADFFSAFGRPDLIGQEGVEYMIFDLRRPPFCLAPPPDAYWANVTRLAALILPSGSEACLCASPISFFVACVYAHRASALTTRDARCLCLQTSRATIHWRWAPPLTPCPWR